MIVYLKSHRRRPICVGGKVGSIDLQIPFWWCECCGKEVFTQGRRLCRKCAEQKGVEA